VAGLVQLVQCNQLIQYWAQANRNIASNRGEKNFEIY